MANEQNLIPNSQRSPKEVRENGRKGGIASGKTRKAKKSFREAAKWVLGMETNAVIDGKRLKISQFEAITLDLWRMAMDKENKNRLQAIQMLQNMIGDESAQEKLKAEIERIKAETKRISGDDKQDNNGKLSELIKGLQDDLYTETVAANEAVATEQAETPKST